MSSSLSSANRSTCSMSKVFKASVLSVSMAICAFANKVNERDNMMKTSRLILLSNAENHADL